MITMQDDIFRVGRCMECDEEEILDTGRDICYSCWCRLDLEAHESESASFDAGNDDTEEE